MCAPEFVTVSPLWIPLCHHVCRCVFTSAGTGRMRGVNWSNSIPHTASINEHTEGNVQTTLSQMEVEEHDINHTKYIFQMFIFSNLRQNVSHMS